MDKALRLLQIQRQAMEAASENELGFHAVNATKKLVDYRRAVFWTGKHRIRLQNVSGNALIDENGPHALWIQQKILKEIKALGGDQMSCEISQADNEKEAEGVAPCVMLVVFRYGEQNDIIGGLWIERETEFEDGEKHILEELAFYYTRALFLSRGINKRDFLPLSERMRSYKKYIWAVLILLLFVPVRLVITAPAEVVAVSSQTVSIPFDGVLKDISVRPGARVKEGEVIARMDVQALALQADTAMEALRAAEAKLSQLNREVLQNPERKAELGKVLADIKAKEIEASYAQSQLQKAEIRAPRDGVAIFADVNDFREKPVQTGQTIMQIADPEQTELLVRVPLQAIIPVDKTSTVSFFPNAAPLRNYAADIQSIGYQASKDSDGLLSYKIRAGFSEKAQGIRIGWKGVAKIRGDWSVLGYRILRRPLIALRNMAGV